MYAKIPDFAREIQRLVVELEKERDTLERQASTAWQVLETIRHKIAVMREALAIYHEHSPFQQPVGEVDHRLREKFCGLSTKEMLLKVAEECGGLLDGSDACRSLVRAGMFKNYRNASGTVYSTLSRHPELFQRVGKGKYRLTWAKRELTDATRPVPAKAASLELVRTG